MIDKSARCENAMKLFKPACQFNYLFNKTKIESGGLISSYFPIPFGVGFITKIRHEQQITIM